MLKSISLDPSLLLPAPTPSRFITTMSKGKMDAAAAARIRRARGENVS